jgi:hypothetical protein
VAGRLVSVVCTDFPPDMDGFGTFVISSGGGCYRMPKRGRRLRTGDLTRPLDHCRVALVRRRQRSKEPIVAVPLGELVALSSPSDTPPGKLGYYSDGAERTVVAIVSRPGRRLSIEGEPDGVLRTNVSNFIFGDRDP